MAKGETSCALRVRATIDGAAAEWLARRDAGLTAGEQAQFDAWRAADLRHAEAWAELEASWAAFDRPRRTGCAGEMVVALASRQRRRRWRAAAGFSVGLAAAGLALLVVAPLKTDRAAPDAVAAKILLRPDARLLPDGSRVELNAGAEVELDFSAARRSIRLTRGEAHFTVAKDPGRPFVVTVGDLEVRAVGTEFVIRRETHAVDLLVTEGTVAVDRPLAAEVVTPNRSEPKPTPLLVGAGRHLLVANVATAGELPRATAVDPAEIERRLAWRGPRLELSGTPLGEAVAVFNRENDVRIVVRDPALRAMRLSGVFRADNPEGLVRLLESHYGVLVERRGTKELHLSTAP